MSASKKATLAAPRLCLRVGVTANRWRKDGEPDDMRINPANRESLENTLLHVLTQLSHAVDAVHHAGVRDEFYAPESPIVRLICPLAEGGDRIVATVVKNFFKSWELYVITPEDISRKPDRDPIIPLDDLWNHACGKLILGGEQLGNESLIEVNRRLLWNCDLLLAVWDKQGALGEAGTGNMIQLASELGLPVIIVDAEPMVKESALEPNGELAPHAFRVVEADTTLSSEGNESAVRKVVSRLLEPPRQSAEEELEGGEEAGGARQLLNSFRREKVGPVWVRWLTGFAWALMMKLLTFRLFTRKTKHSLNTPAFIISSDVAAGYPPPWERSRPRLTKVENILKDWLSPSFRHADYFASAYATRHRGATVWLVILAPIVVACGWFTKNFFEPLVWLELALLVAIVFVYWRAQSKKFHERWLDYRLLAERLRHLGFLWMVARGSLVQRVPLPTTPEDPHTAWVNWWYRATARQIPMPSAEFTSDYLRAYRDFLLHDVVEDQRNYLRGTFHAAELAEKALRFLAWSVFLLALLGSAIHAFHFHFLPELPRTFDFIGLVLPGFGAALHAFASNLGLPEQALRSRSTIRALSVLADGLQNVDIADDATRAHDGNPNDKNLLTSIELGDLAQQTANALGDDLVGWRVDYLVRPTPQPG